MNNKKKISINLFRFFFTIRFKLLMSYIGIAVISISIMGIQLYHICTNTIQQKVSESTLDKLNKVNAVVEQRIGNVINFINSFISNPQINNILNKRFTEYQYPDVNTIISIIESGTKATDLISSVVVYTSNGHLYKTGKGAYMSVSDIIDSDWYNNIAGNQQKAQLYWLGTYKNMPSDDAQIAVVGRLSALLNQNNHGIMYVGISPDAIYPMSNFEGDFFIIDESLEILVHSNKEKIGTLLNEIKDVDKLFQNDEGYFVQEMDNQKYLLVYCTSKPTGWKIMQLIPMDSLSMEIKEFNKIFFTILIVIIAVVLIFSLFISRMISEPIKKLTKLTNEVEKGNLNVKADIRNKDEIGGLGRSFNRMVTKLQELIETIYEQEQKKKQIEIEMLQAQIDPHFLYNTLGSIRWMAVIHNVQSINDMITSLIKFLKLRLSPKGTLITLKEEIDSLEQYIYILNVRYNNGIKFACNLPEELKNYRIIRFLLQPFVENAIIHGIKPKGGVGNISIDCCTEDGKVKISILDDGIGMDAEQADYLMNSCNTGGNKLHNSIGIRNVVERIKLHYGEEYGINIESEKGFGTKVTVVIPEGEQHEG